MEKTIKYKRFRESHTESTLQEFFDRLVTEGWEIIYYSEVSQGAGALTNSPTEMMFHITIVASKKQSNVL